MIDKNGKELTTTLIVEENDTNKRVQTTLSAECNIEELFDAFYGALLNIGWQERTIKLGMYEYAKAKLEMSDCYNEYYEPFSYEEVKDEACADERYDLRKYAKDNAINPEDITKEGVQFVDVNKFIEHQINKNKKKED